MTGRVCPQSHVVIWKSVDADEPSFKKRKQEDGVFVDKLKFSLNITDSGRAASCSVKGVRM